MARMRAKASGGQGGGPPRRASKTGLAMCSDAVRDWRLGRPTPQTWATLAKCRALAKGRNPDAAPAQRGTAARTRQAQTLKEARAQERGGVAPTQRNRTAAASLEEARQRIRTASQFRLGDPPAPGTARVVKLANDPQRRVLSGAISTGIDSRQRLDQLRAEGKWTDDPAELEGIGKRIDRTRQTLEEARQRAWGVLGEMYSDPNARLAEAHRINKAMRWGGPAPDVPSAQPRRGRELNRETRLNDSIARIEAALAKEANAAGWSPRAEALWQRVAAVERMRDRGVTLREGRQQHRQEFEAERGKPLARVADLIGERRAAMAKMSQPTAPASRSELAGQARDLRRRMQAEGSRAYKDSGRVRELREYAKATRPERPAPAPKPAEKPLERVAEVIGQRRQAIAGIGQAPARAKTVRPFGQAKPTPSSQPTATSTTEPGPGFIGRMKTTEIQVDPERFQYKGNLTDSKTGTTEALKDVRSWNEELAGVVSVWKDPSNGRTYVVNGHHRHALASRLGVDQLPVRFIDAPDAQTARAKGALQNIAEGRGSTLDAAKFVRDAGIDRQGFEAAGVSMREKQVDTALGAAKVTGPVWQEVYNERLKIEHAAAIGNADLPPSAQVDVMKDLQERSDAGKAITDSYLAETISDYKDAPTQTSTTASLFGDVQDDKKLAKQSRELRANVMERLGKDRRVFGSAVRNASRLEAGGNRIDVATSEQIAKESGTNAEAFQQFKRSPILKGAIDEAAIQLEAAKTRGDRKKIEDDLYEEIIKRIRQALA